jgi:outer membrane protein TolC
MIIVSRAESAYWNLVFAQERYRMSEESVAIAKELVKDSEERVKAGKMSELDLLEAETGLSIRLSNQEDASRNLSDAITEIKLLISSEDIDAETNITAIDAMDSPMIDGGMSEEGTRAWIELALKTQPQYRITQDELARERIVRDFRRSELFPELTLRGSWGLNGLGDSPEDSLGSIESQRYPAWSLGLEMRMPLFMGIRQHNQLTATQLNMQLLKKQIASLKYEIINSINSLVRRIETLEEQIENARKVIAFREKLLAVEFSRLEAGKSNIRLVFEAEEELNLAKEDELETMLRYREAIMELAFMRGSVLLDRGLERMVNDEMVIDKQITSESK